MAETLYERLGGAEGIAAIVDDAVDRHAVNPALALRFCGQDLPRLKKLGTRFFCAGTGGPDDAGAGDLHAAYAGAAMSEQEFLATMDDVAAALDGQGVAASEAHEVMAILFALQFELPCPPCARFSPSPE
jgi:hemoglobin